MTLTQLSPVSRLDLYVFSTDTIQKPAQSPAAMKYNSTPKFRQLCFFDTSQVGYLTYQATHNNNDPPLYADAPQNLHPILFSTPNHLSYLQHPSHLSESQLSCLLKLTDFLEPQMLKMPSHALQPTHRGMRKARLYSMTIRPCSMIKCIVENLPMARYIRVPTTTQDDLIRQMPL